jgi:hypothetical protein
MSIPDRVSADWIATLGDAQLIDAESQLRDIFHQQETLEKRRRGSRYAVLEGPELLVNAWHRWVMVSNEARTRGLVVRHRR